MKTALVLGGGGSRGAYEMGAWQALREMGIEIDLVTGTSIGSMNAALIAQDAYEAGRELWLTLKTDEIFDYKHAIENKGVKFTSIKDIMNKHLSEEAVRASKIDLGLVTVKFPSMKPLLLWKEDIPEGQLMDYIFASCSCFPVVMPYEIDGISFVDGGYTDNMPVGMALQKNPDKIIAVDLDSVGHMNTENLEAAKDRLTLIKCYWELGNMAVFNPAHSADIMRLGYLDTFKAFGAFTGKKYAFLRGQFLQREILAIETLGEFFGIDPKCIYTKEIYMHLLKTEIEEFKNGTDEELLAVKRDFEAYKKRALNVNLSELLQVIKLAKQAHQAGALAKRAYFVGLADLYSKTPALFKPRSVQKLLSEELAAVQWLVAQNML